MSETALTHRQATHQDLPAIVALLVNDTLGQHREQLADTLDSRYEKAFDLIHQDPNQYLMVVERSGQIVGTCHLTMMPSLTFTGSMRMQIEAVRVDASLRGQKIGEWMMKAAIAYGKKRGATLIQLSTNKQRDKARIFYERLGFEASHEGMKLYFT